MPVNQSKRDSLFELVGTAVNAPASARSGPWSVVLDAEEIARFAKGGRKLGLAPPDERERTISCGTAVFDLRVASEAHGMEARVDLPEGAAHGDVLATVQMQPARPGHSRLADAIDIRRTYRAAFAADEVPAAVRRRLVSAVTDEGASVVVVGGERRAALADLVASGDRALFSNRRWRRELASWMHPRRKPDGLASCARVGGRPAVSAGDVADRAARQDHDLAVSAPFLAVIATAADERADWLRAGEALEHLLLEAAASGLEASFLNQPCQVPSLRARLRDLLPGRTFPQLVVRVGYPQNRTAA